MADETISQLSVYSAYHSDDEWEVLDVHDATMAPAGTNKRVTFASFISLANLVTVGGAPIAESQVTGLTADLAARATDSLVVHLAGIETITGAKTFSTVPTWPAQSANQLFAGPSTGAAAAPTFRALAAADLPFTLGPNLTFSGTSLRSRVPLAWVTASGTAVTNSVALTSLFSGATLGGSLTIPANTLVPGSRLTFELFGTCNSGGSLTLFVELLLGGTIIGKGTSSTWGNVRTGNIWGILPGFNTGFYVQAAGASGKIIGSQTFNAAEEGNTILNVTGTQFNAPTQVTIDTTVSQALDVKVQWSGASASNSIQLTHGCIYLDF